MLSDLTTKTTALISPIAFMFLLCMLLIVLPYISNVIVWGDIDVQVNKNEIISSILCHSAKAFWSTIICLQNWQEYEGVEFILHFTYWVTKAITTLLISYAGLLVTTSFCIKLTIVWWFALFVLHSVLSFYTLLIPEYPQDM